MKLILTNHLKSRLKLRNIPESSVKNIFKKAEEFYWDNLRQHHIIISMISYKGRLRKMLAAYDTIGDEIEVITIHPITDEEISQRINSGRWIYENDQN